MESSMGTILPPKVRILCAVHHKLIPNLIYIENLETTDLHLTISFSSLANFPRPLLKHFACIKTFCSWDQEGLVQNFTVLVAFSLKLFAVDHQGSR